MAKSTNTIRTIRRLLPGDEFTDRVDPQEGDGYFRATATEPGYWLSLADCVVFIPDSLLKAAEAEHRAEDIRKHGCVECLMGGSKMAGHCDSGRCGCDCHERAATATEDKPTRRAR